MAQVFGPTGESSEEAIFYPDLLGNYIPQIDVRSAEDGLGLASPWGAGPMARQTGDAGSYTTVGGIAGGLTTNITGQTLNYDIEGIVGPQGLQGPPGEPGSITTIKQQVFVPYGNPDLDEVLQQIRDNWQNGDTILYASDETIRWDRPWVHMPVKAGVTAWNDASAGTDGQFLGIAADSWLFTSTDGGDNWTEKDPGSENYSAIRVSGTSGDAVAVGETSSADGTIWVTTDSGTNWALSTAIGGAGYTEEESYILGEDASVKIQDYAVLLDPYGYRAGQSWQVTAGGYSVNRIKVKVAKNGSPGTINCHIYALSAGTPTGSPLGSTSLDGDTFNASPSYDWVSFDFSPAVALTGSTSYAFTFDVPAGDDSNNVEVRVDATTPTFGNGSVVYTIDNGSSWSTDVTRDMQFYVYSQGGTEVTNVDLSSNGDDLAAFTVDGVWLSDDLGTSWTQYKPDGSDNTTWDAGIISLSGTYVVAFDDGGNVYRTANSGTDWALVDVADSETFTPVAIDSSDDGQYVIIVGTNSTDSTHTITFSDDYGATWAWLTNPTIAGANYNWTQVQISNTGKLILVSRTGAAYITFNSAEDWEQASIPASEDTWFGAAVSGDGKVGILANLGTANEYYQNSGWYSKPTISETDITATARSILDDATTADVATTIGLGTGDSPEFTGLTLSGLTASNIVATDGSKALVSLADPLVVGHGGTGVATLTTAYGLLAAGTTATGAVQTLAAGLTTQILVGGGASALPAWGTDIPTAVTIGSAYVYRVGGTDVSVADGGTGASTLTDHSILLGSGTDAVTALGAATDGQLPIGSTGADPVLATLTGTANQITVTNGAGSITLSTPIISKMVCYNDAVVCINDEVVTAE